jgi:hypothetical protein
VNLERKIPMAVMHYQTRDGLAHYGFSIEYQPDIGWRAYIIFDPSCAGIDDIPQLPYQSIDVDKRRYVDWLSPLNSLGDAKIVAELWAELTYRYQRAHEKHDLYVKLFEQHRQTREQRETTRETTEINGATAEGKDCSGQSNTDAA